MNIRKKISFFTLFLISSFFIMGEVKGYYCSSDGSACVDSSGTSVGSQASLTPGKLSTLEEASVYSYRITLVKQDGTKVAGPKNVTFGSGFNYTDYYYNTYKFSNSFNVANSLTNGKINTSYISHYESSDKTYFKYIENQIINYIKGTNTTFVKNLGFAQTINDYINNNEYLFAIVEKNYEVAFSSKPIENVKTITYASMCESEYYRNIYDKVETNDSEYACGDRGPYIHNPNGPAFNEVNISRTIKYYVGTGSEIARLIEYVNNGNKVPKTNYTASDVGNLKFSSNGGSLGLFGKQMMVDENGLKLNFTPLKKIAPSCESNNLTCIYNKSYGYAYGLIRITSSSGCNSKADADSLGLSWNMATGQCCAKGEIYDSSTKKCTGNTTWSTSKSFTPTGTTTTYTYTASPSVNICKNSTVNSTINNLSSCSYKKNNGSETKLTGSSLADCVLYNQKYFVGTYAGNDVYCMETLNTNFSNFRLNFASKYSSGKFIPISKYPSLTKNVTCYAPGSSDTSLYTYLNTSGIKNLTTNMKVKVNFLNENNYQFVNSSKNITENNKSTGKTSYGTNYTSLNFSVLYNYSYVNDSLNKYIKIQNAQGGINKINSEYKTMTQDINFKISMDTNPGTYSTSISLDGLDSNVSNITNGTDYQKQLTTTGGTSYCRINYEESNIDIGYCKTKFNNLKENGTVEGYDASWNNNLCEIEITYSGFTETACDGISKSNIAIKTNYFTSGNTTKLKFVNNSASSNISCSFNIEVGKKIEDILIYRPIDLSNPFPGKNGKGRTAGSNWSKSDITNYITSRQDAYTKQPMYSFTLTPSNIKTIREYNKKHTYDDFNLECKGEGTACFSNFIQNYINTSKSFCFRAKSEWNVTNFNSCADYTKR